MVLMKPRVERRVPDAIPPGLRSEHPSERQEGPAEARLRGARCRLADDVEARNRVVQENLGLVFRVARQYANRGLTWEDLVAEGNLGLIRAAEQYDSRFGTRFSTYAVFHIKEAIRSALANTATTVRLPINVSRLLDRWRRIERRLWHVHGRRPTFEEVATAMALDQPARRLIELAHRVSRVETPYADSRAGQPLERSTLDGGARPDESLAAEEEQESVSRRLERLEAMEHAVIVLRYGLQGEPPMSLERIRQQLGITRAAVVKLISNALRKLGPRGKA
jgi:RNA polymerase primary sigma factor